VILYYAIGGGLGHLVRARAVLHTLGIEGEAVVLTASTHASDRRVVGELPVIRAPDSLDHDRAELRRWLDAVLAAVRPERVIVDAFPAGVLGELRDLDVPVDHVARLLRWPRYVRRLDGPLPQIETTFVVEPLHPDHRTELAAASSRMEPLHLVDPPAPIRDDAAGAAPVDGAALVNGAALVVHAGPDHEVEALVSLARSTGRRVMVARPGGGDLDVHPAAALFPHAGHIVTAAGFNAMRQAAPFRDRHTYVPFPRPLDDQHARAQLASGGGGGGGGGGHSTTTATFFSCQSRTMSSSRY
jgi:hypothetical protein